MTAPSNLMASGVIETTTTTGNGTVTLGGVPSGTTFGITQTFNTGIGVGNFTTYRIESGNGTDWEEGWGVIGGSGPYTMTRNLIASSTGSLLVLSGTSLIYATIPAKQQRPTIRPLLSSFSWFNQASASATDNPGCGLALSCATSPSGGFILMDTATPGSTPWTCKMRLRNTSPAVAYLTYGIGYVREASSGKITFLGHGSNGGLAIQNIIQLTYQTGSGGSHTNIGYWSFDRLYDFWIKIYNDGSNINFSISSDGETFMYVGQQGSTAYGTPDRVGFGMGTNDNGDSSGNTTGHSGTGLSANVTLLEWTLG